MMNIPFELIEDILRRLPVKTLKRCRSVAKSWLALIDGAAFVKSHLRHSMTSNSTNRRLILAGLGLYTVDLDSPQRVNAVKPPFYYRSIDGISSSCNGLVLVMSENPVIWNPYSTEYKVLPKSSVLRPVDLGLYSASAYAFVYVSGIDDYKVVRVMEYRVKANHDYMSSITEIYSLRSNTWRSIDPFPYKLPLINANWSAHVDGVLYMLVNEDVDRTSIMAFSLESERHYEKTMPRGAETRGVKMSLEELGGCLCLVCLSKYRVTIWVTEEERWRKLLSVAPPALEARGMVKPLVYSRDGRRVLLNIDEKSLVWYDLEKKSVDEVSIDGMPFVFYAEHCVESLVSIDGFGEVKKQGLVKKKEKRMRNKRDLFLSEGFKLVL